MLAQKAMDDAAFLKKHAHFAVILDYDQFGQVFLSETIDNSEHGYIANVIAVLAPVRPFENSFCLDQGLVLEIGLSRGRPYRRAKTKKCFGINGKHATANERRKLREITPDELRTALHEIVSIIVSVTKNRRSSWKSQDAWFVLSIGREVERGAYFTVSESDALVAHYFITEDTRYRTEKYLRRKALNISWWLRRFKFDSYTDGKLKSFVGIQKAIDLWGNAGWEHRLGRAVLSNLSWRRRELMRLALRAYGLKDPFDDDPSYPNPLAEGVKKLHKVNGTYFYIPPRTRLGQAKGCIVFECLPEKEK